MLVGCTQEEPVSKLSGLEVDNDYVSVAADEGSAVTIKVKGDDSWTAAIPDTKVDWLTVNPTSGAAGQEVTVTFTASKAAANLSLCFDVADIALGLIVVERNTELF